MFPSLAARLRNQSLSGCSATLLPSVEPTVTMPSGWLLEMGLCWPSWQAYEDEQKVPLNGVQNLKLSCLRGEDGRSYLVHSTQIFKKAPGTTEQGFNIWADDDVSHIPLGAVWIQEKLLPVRQRKRRQHHKVVLIADQKGRNGQRLWRLICA